MIPIALHLENKNVLVVGAGKVAGRKIRQYLKEKANVFVVSPEYDLGMNVNYICDDYHPKYLEGMFMVYAATSDRTVNHKVVEDCKDRNILCGNSNYDEDSSLYSMNRAENEVGMIALSTNQKYPYSKPLLDEMMGVLEAKKERLTLVYELRAYILKYSTESKEYMNNLYTLDIEWLRFIHHSVMEKKGYIFIYHPEKLKEAYHFSLSPSLCLGLDEFERLQNLLIFEVQYKIIPLILSEGIIYHRIQKKITIPHIMMPAVFTQEQDLKEVLEILRENQNQNTIYIIHPRKNNALKETIKRNLMDNESIFDFTEAYSLKNNMLNRVILLLVTHGTHYQNVKRELTMLDNMGFEIDFKGNLLDDPRIIHWIENKVK